MEILDVAVTVNRGATTTAGRKWRKCEKWFNALMEEQPEIVIAVMQVGGTYPCLTCLYPFHATYFVVDVCDPAHDLNLDTY